MIEKLKAKIEFHECRNETSEVDKLREKIKDIEDKAAARAERLAGEKEGRGYSM